MALPNVRLNVVDGNLGLLAPGADKVLVIGHSSLGTPGEIKTYSQPNALITGEGRGPKVTGACHVIDQAGVCDVLEVAASVAASTTIDDTPTAGDVPITLTGTPLEYYLGKVRITLDGERGVGRFDYTLDGLSFGAVRTIPAAGTFTVPDSGLVMNFAAVSAAVQSGSGPAITADGTPTGDNDIVITIKTAGVNGTATFDLDVDGTNVASGVTVPTTPFTYVDATTGLTFTFADDTWVLNETYTFHTGYNAGTEYDITCIPAQPNGTDLDVAASAIAAVSTRWKAILWCAHSADVATAVTLAAQIAGVHDTMADQARMNRGLVMVSGNAADLQLCDDSINQLPATYIANMSTFGGTVRTGAESLEEIRLAVFAGMDRLSLTNPIEGWRHAWQPNNYSAAGRVARYTRATNIGWVGGGRLEKVSAINFDEYLAGEQLHDVLINSTRTFIGKTGQFFTNGLLKSPAGSDFRYLSWGLAFDLLCETVNDGLLAWVNATVRVNPDGSGTIHPLDAAKIDGVINALIKAAVLDPRNEQGFNGFFSDAASAVDQSYNILTNKKLRVNVRGVPLANLEDVDVYAGLFTSLIPVEALEAAAA